MDGRGGGERAIYVINIIKCKYKLPRHVEHDGPAEQQLLDPLLDVHFHLERHVDEVAVQNHLGDTRRGGKQGSGRGS